MINKNKDEKQKAFFTITTPRKDGSILDQFLTEFGYKSFETEERSEDTRRSIVQISSNEELVEEVADFCKENKCKMQLIYKRGEQLVQQTFQSDKAYSPKPYGQSEGEKLQDVPEEIAHQNKQQKEIDDSIKPLFIGKNNNIDDSIKPLFIGKQAKKNPLNNKNKPSYSKPTKKVSSFRAEMDKRVKKQKTPEEINALNPNHPSHPDHPKNPKNLINNDDAKKNATIKSEVTEKTLTKKVRSPRKISIQKNN